MAMVSVVNWQPANGLMAQTDRLGPKVGGHLALCCIHLCNDNGSCYGPFETVGDIMTGQLIDSAWVSSVSLYV